MLLGQNPNINYTMKLNKIKIQVPIFTSLFFLCQSCSINISEYEPYIKKELWQYESGYKIGDKDGFCIGNSNNVSLKNDTIFFKATPNAIIVKIDSSMHRMELKSINSGEQGVYYSTRSMDVE